jgi:hypothetical protein
MGFNSAFKGLKHKEYHTYHLLYKSKTLHIAHIEYLELHTILTLNSHHFHKLDCALLQHPELLWAPHCLLFNGYLWPCPRGQSRWSVKLATHLHVVLELRMSGATPQLSHMPKKCMQKQLYFYIYLFLTP